MSKEEIHNDLNLKILEGIQFIQTRIFNSEKDNLVYNIFDHTVTSSIDIGYFEFLDSDIDLNIFNIAFSFLVKEKIKTEFTTTYNHEKISSKIESPILVGHYTIKNNAGKIVHFVQYSMLYKYMLLQLIGIPSS